MLIKRKEVIRIIFFIVGLIILSLGIALIIKSQFGASAWDAVSVALAAKLGLSVGIWLNIVAVILLCIAGIMLKKIPRFSTLITSIGMGICLDLWLKILKMIDYHSAIYSLVVFIIGIGIMGLGVAIYLVSKLPPNPLDYFMICLHEKFHISIAIARTILESIGFILGLLLGGPIGLGTVIILVLVGPIIQFFFKYTTMVYDYIVIKTISK